MSNFNLAYLQRMGLSIPQPLQYPGETVIR